MQQKPNNNFKILLMGDQRVGKTKLTIRLQENSYTEEFTRIGIDFIFRTLSVYDESIKFQVWDPHTSDRCFRPVFLEPYYRKVMGVVLVYDITNRDSFLSLTKYHEQTIKHAPENAIIIIAGLKADLEEERTVTNDEGREFAESLGCIYIETSAKTGMNVDNLFLVLGKEIIERKKFQVNNDESVNIKKKDNSSEGSKKRLLCAC